MPEETAPSPSSMQLTPLGKLFFASLLSWIGQDAKFNWKLKGDPDKIDAMVKAIFASKEFHVEVKNPNATVETVIQKLNAKNDAAANFEQVSGGIRWPL